MNHDRSVWRWKMKKNFKSDVEWCRQVHDVRLHTARLPVKLARTTWRAHGIFVCLFVFWLCLPSCTYPGQIRIASPISLLSSLSFSVCVLFMSAPPPPPLSLSPIASLSLSLSLSLFLLYRKKKMNARAMTDRRTRKCSFRWKFKMRLLTREEWRFIRQEVMEATVPADRTYNSND